MIISDEDPSLRIVSFAIIILRSISTKLHFNLIFTMQTYKELVRIVIIAYILMYTFATGFSRQYNEFFFNFT